MTRTAEGATLALLDALEPEAKAAWEAELINLQEAIAASQAITNKAQVATMADANTITLKVQDTEKQEQVPGTLRSTYDPDYEVEP